MLFRSRAGMPLECDSDRCAHFVELRKTYEPFVAALAIDMLLTLPEWIHPNPTLDNWQTSAWDEGSVAHFRRTPHILKRRRI